MLLSQVSDYDLHAMAAARRCREVGLADSIHHAPEWDSRADALYDRLKSLVPSVTDEMLAMPRTIGLLADGRMVAWQYGVAVYETAEDIAQFARCDCGEWHYADARCLYCMGDVQRPVRSVGRAW